MANSFEELIFSRDPESQHGRKQKCFKYCAILVLAFAVFIIPYAIAKVEISAFKNEIREEINGLKMKEREQLKNEMVDFTKNDNLQNEVGELKREITKLKSNEEAHQNEINEMKKEIQELKEKKELGKADEANSDTEISQKISNLENQIKAVKDQELPQKVSDLENQIEAVKNQDFSQKISNLENQIEAVKNQSSAFFKYDIIQGTESAFYRFEEKMNFKVDAFLNVPNKFTLVCFPKQTCFMFYLQDGQKACSDGYGYLIEFHDKTNENDYVQFVEKIINVFDLRVPETYHDHRKTHFDFYIGLTDFQKEDQWIWQSSGQIFNMTQSRKLWGENQPDGNKREDCGFIMINSKHLYEKYPHSNPEHKFPLIADINCAEKLTIICQRKVIP